MNNEGALATPESSSVGLAPAYQTEVGEMYEATAEEFLGSRAARPYCGRVDLTFTSPPFPLNRKKSYGNLQGDQYVEWFAGLAPQLSDLLGKQGSIVIELGNAWERGSPTMSTLALEALLAFRRKAELFLCQ